LKQSAEEKESTMKIYYHPVSTTCRPIMLSAAAERSDIELHLVDLFAGENYQEPYTAINPNQAVPVLEDGDFLLAESSAILKYLADKFRSASYPADLQSRARVNERMDWFNTGLYRDLGYGLIYPQVIDAYRHSDDAVHRANLASARGKATRWLKAGMKNEECPLFPAWPDFLTAPRGV
jgi:glutathione S-transferase